MKSPNPSVFAEDKNLGLQNGSAKMAVFWRDAEAHTCKCTCCLKQHGGSQIFDKTSIRLPSKFWGFVVRKRTMSFGVYAGDLSPGETGIALRTRRVSTPLCTQIDPAQSQGPLWAFRQLTCKRRGD